MPFEKGKGQGFEDMRAELEEFVKRAILTVIHA